MDGCTIVGFAFIVLQGTIHCPAPATPSARLCEVARVIKYSSQDTADTRKQLRYHNAAVRSACGGAK